VFCSIRYPDRTGFNTEASSLFQAAANALHWCEVDRRAFGTARRFRDDQILVISAGMRAEKVYRVNIGRIRKW
jgi:hypothetical protein